MTKEVAIRITSDEVDHAMRVADAADIELVAKMLRRQLRLPHEPKTERVCPDSEDGNHVLKQDSPFSIVYCDACGMNKGFRGEERTNDG